MNGLVTAMRTLTVIPMPGKDAERFTQSLFFFPIVGAFIGALTALIAWAVGVKAGWPQGAGVFCLAFTCVITGGLHLDGLADVFDALGASTRERRLAIMKDPNIGAYGIIAVAVCLIAKFAAIARLVETGCHGWIIIPYIVSRTVQVELAAILPYARNEGGTGKNFVEESSVRHFVMACVPALALCLAGTWDVLGIAMLAGACVACLALAAWMRRVFGGVTGDLIGMGSEVFEAGVFAALALVCR